MVPNKEFKAVIFYEVAAFFLHKFDVKDVISGYTEDRFIVGNLCIFFLFMTDFNSSNLQNRFNRFTEPFTPYFLFSKYDLIYFLTSIFVNRNERQ